MIVNTHRSMRYVLAGIASLVLAATDASASASFQGLGDLTGGIFNSKASAISADGLVVVGSSSSSSGTEAFRWSLGGGMVGLGELPGGAFYSEANDVSADGSVIVGQSVIGFSAVTQTESFVWTASGGIAGLGDLPGGDFINAANAVSADGSVVVGTGSIQNNKEAFRWTAAGGMVSIGLFPFPNFPDADGYSYGQDVSGDGLIVVGTANSVPGYEFSGQAYRWTESTGMVLLGILPNNAHSPTSRASAISANGLVVVGDSSSDGGGPPVSESFYWTSGGGMVGLGFLPGTTYGYDNYAHAVSADGSVIVGYSDTDTPNGRGAYLWTADEGMRLLQDVLTGLGLDLTGWTLAEATGISDDGLTIVGWGLNPDGNQEAFIARLPEPGILTIFGLGIAAILRRGRMAIEE